MVFPCRFYVVLSIYSRHSTTKTTKMGSPTSSPASTGRCRLCCYHGVNDASLPRKLYRIRFFLYFFLVYALLLTAQWPLKWFHRTRTQARRCINQSRVYVSGRSVGGKENEKKINYGSKIDLTSTTYIIIVYRRVDRILFFV